MLNKDEDVLSVFIMGKAQVSSTKVTTIPRLEPTAAAVSVTANNMVIEELLYSQWKSSFGQTVRSP